MQYNYKILLDVIAFTGHSSGALLHWKIYSGSLETIEF